MRPSSFASEFLDSLPVVKLSNLWAHQQCDICQEPFFTWAENPLKLPYVPLREPSPLVNVAVPCEPCFYPAAYPSTRLIVHQLRKPDC